MSDDKSSLRIVVTGARLPAAPAQVWEHLLFFEQVPGPPPFFLARLLPSPERVEGCRSRAGEETRCVYAQGYLVKRITAAIPHRLLAFDVIEQALEIGRGIRLEGGSYRLVEMKGATRVTLETRYRAPDRWRVFWRPFDAAVAHAFHRHLIAALRHGLQSPAAPHFEEIHTPTAATTPAAAMSPSPIATRRP